MLIPIDVHDLLVKFADNGYNPRLWDALALKVPPGQVGEQWRAANIAQRRPARYNPGGQD